MQIAPKNSLISCKIYVVLHHTKAHRTFRIDRLIHHDAAVSLFRCWDLEAKAVAVLAFSHPQLKFDNITNNIICL